jgi:cytochrome P450
MAFLEAYNAIADAIGKIQLFQKWLVENPTDLFTELRAQQPIFVTPGPIVVSRYRDVVEVASLDEIYSVKPYGVAMMRDNGGPNFILGMENGPEFETDLSILHLAVRRNDLDSIRAIVARHAAAALDAARSVGRFDITEGYAHLVPAQFAGEYFGVPGPDSGTLIKWVRAMFADLFLNFSEDPGVIAAAVQAGQEFRTYVDSLIASIQANGRTKDDVICRLIAMQCNQPTSFSNSRLRDNLIGCVTGILENTNTAVVNIIDFLLDHPEQMAGAVSAARSNDNDLLLRYVLETMRFHTPAPVLVRLSLADHVLAKGTPFEASVPAGKLVFAANASAMMDETELDHPLEFNLSRPSHHYLHFGWGLHQCLGKYISQVQIVEIIKVLLKLPGLRRAQGPDGHLTFTDSFPDKFSVEFDVAPSQTANS